MAELDELSIYSIDTSSFMDWQARHYPTDVFPGIANAVISLVNAKRLFACELVNEELGVVGTDELVNWAKENKQLFVSTSELLAAALAIQNQFPGLLDSKAEYEEADAYVIALARLRGAIVVTQETPAAEKRNPKRSHYIPDVCTALGIRCVSWLDMMRNESWAF